MNDKNTPNAHDIVHQSSLDLFEKFDKVEQKELRALARELCKKTQDFYDKRGPYGCAYCDVVDVVAALASDMTFEV